MTTTHLCWVNDDHVLLGVLDVRLVEGLENDDADFLGHFGRLCWCSSKREMW